MGWQDEIRRRVTSCRDKVPQADVERITTTCLEAIMGEVNHQLHQRTIINDEMVCEPIPFEAVLRSDHSSSGEGLSGLYFVAKSVVCDHMYQWARQNRPADTRTVQALNILSDFVPIEDRLEMLHSFCGKHPQLQQIELGTAEALYAMVQRVISPMAQEALDGVVAERMERPPSGRMV